MTILVMGVLAIWTIVFAAMAIIPLMIDGDRHRAQSPLPLPMEGRGNRTGNTVELHEQAA